MPASAALVIHHGQTPDLLRPHGIESGVNVILRQAEEHLGERDISHEGIAGLGVASAQRNRDIPVRDHADRTPIFHHRKRATPLFPKDFCNGRQIRIRTAESDAFYHDILDFHSYRSSLEPHLYWGYDSIASTCT